MDDAIPSTPVQLLLIDQQPADALIAEEWLAAGDFHLTACRSSNALSDGLALLRAQRFDVVLLDAGSPSGAKLDGLLRLRRQAPDVPVIVLARSHGEDVERQSARCGAYDCLVKGQFGGPELRRRIRFAAATHTAWESALSESKPWERIVSDIAHDINNAMAPVAICVESVLESEPELSEQSRDSLSIVLRASDVVAETVARLRGESREEDPVLVPDEDESPAAARGAPGTPSQRILVVDDDPLLLKSLRDVLVNDGHQVTAVSGGEAAVEAFQDAASKGRPFALVITDLGMAGLDGRQVARAVKADSETPVILLTGWGQRLLGDEDVPPHVDCVLNKPPKLAELRNALVTLTANRPFLRP